MNSTAAYLLDNELYCTACPGLMILEGDVPEDPKRADPFTPVREDSSHFSHGDVSCGRCGIMILSGI